MNLRNEKFRSDSSPLDEETACFASQDFSLAYLRHLLTTGEMLGPLLLTLPNLPFFVLLLEQARAHLEAGDFGPWSKTWIERYESGDNE